MPAPHPALRKTVSAMMAASSALLLFVFVVEDFGSLGALVQSAPPWGLVLRYLLAMALAGAVCGALLAGLFGRRGVLGWLLAALGGIVTATLAGLLGSLVGRLPDLLANGWQGTDAVAIAAGALVLPLAATGWAPLLALWAAGLAGTHLLAKRLRHGPAS